MQQHRSISKFQFGATLFLIIAAILFGYQDIFKGKDFFVHQDPVLMSYFSDGNAHGNGWRPDKCFGISTFYGDTQAHAWSGFTFWHRMFESRKTAYTASIVFLSILSGLSFYLLLRKAAPNFGWGVWLLAPIIVFSTFQPAIQYLRFGAIVVGGPLVMLMMHGFYRKPNILYIAGLAASVFFVLLFGSIAAVASMLNLSLFFTLFYFLYYHQSAPKLTGRYLILFAGGLGIAGLLGAWIFYSHLIETLLVGYTREKVSAWPSHLDFIPNFKYFAHYLISLFQVEWISQYLLDSQGLPRVSYAYNAIAVFPTVFVLSIARKAKSFWEFCFKGILFVFLVHYLLMAIPAYAALYSFLAVKSFLVLNLFDISVVFIAQIGLVAIFLSESDFSLPLSLKTRIAYKTTAFILFVFYLGLIVFGLLALAVPGFLPGLVKSLVAHFCPASVGGFSKEFAEFMAFYTLHNLQSAQHWYSLVFYGIHAGLFFCFIKKDGPALLTRNKNKTAALLLISAIAMSWSVYPLNDRPQVWDEVADQLPAFNSTDRFWYVEHDSGGIKTAADFKKRLEIIDNQGRIKLIRHYGYEEYPGLKLHGHKSFTQENVADYVYAIFNTGTEKRLTHIRHLTSGPMVFSDLLDMGAVSHYYTRVKLKNPPENLKLVFEGKWLFIYQNLSAWPYFYLADRTESVNNVMALQGQLTRGTVYLSEENWVDLPKGASTGKVTLKSFSNGEMVFAFNSSQEELLVIADAWHPFWKAAGNGKTFPVLKANGIFKGIRLEPGSYELKVYFDTRPYMPGAYIALGAWLIFLLAVVWSFKNMVLGKKETHFI